MSDFDPFGPCWICGLPVGALSFGGPHVCPACDCGHSPLGTPQENKKRWDVWVAVDQTRQVRVIGEPIIEIRPDRDALPEPPK